MNPYMTFLEDYDDLLTEEEINEPFDDDVIEDDDLLYLEDNAFFLEDDEFRY